jgi:hypothetical protein
MIATTTKRLAIILSLLWLVKGPSVTGLHVIRNGVKDSAASVTKSIPPPVPAGRPIETASSSHSSVAASGDKESEAVLEAAFAKGEELFLSGKNCRPYSSSRQSLVDCLFGNSTRVSGRFSFAPPLTFPKFLTMQEKRVVVTFRYTDVPYLRPYFLTVASRLKKCHADILIEKKKLPLVDSNAHPIFEVLVDGKMVVGAQGSTRQERILAGRVDVDKTQSVFISMEQLGTAIAKARKRRRPTNGYGQGETKQEYTFVQQPQTAQRTKRFHYSKPPQQFGQDG